MENRDLSLAVGGERRIWPSRGCGLRRKVLTSSGTACSLCLSRCLQKQLALVDEMVEYGYHSGKSCETLGWEESNQIVPRHPYGGPGDGPSVKRNLDELSKLLENPLG